MQSSSDSLKLFSIDFFLTSAPNNPIRPQTIAFRYTFSLILVLNRQSTTFIYLFIYLFFCHSLFDIIKPTFYLQLLLLCSCWLRLFVAAGSRQSGSDVIYVNCLRDISIENPYYEPVRTPLRINCNTPLCCEQQQQQKVVLVVRQRVAMAAALYKLL